MIFRKGVFKGIIVLLAFSLAAGLGVSSLAAQEKYTWGSVRIGGGGFVSGIVTSDKEKDLIYARTDVGGAYRWQADTQTWKPLTDWVSEDEMGYLGVESIAIDPKNTNRVYMLVGISYFNGGKTAILRSEDRGDHFEIVDVSSQFKAHGNGMGRQTGEKLMVDPNNSDVIYCGTRWNGLFRSLDRGKTWARLDSLEITSTPNENGISFVAIDPASSAKKGLTQDIYIGVSRVKDNLYVSKDGGATWAVLEQNQEMAGMLDGEMPSRGKFSPDGSLLITLGNGAGPHSSGSIAAEAMDQGCLWKYEPKTSVWSDLSPSYRPIGGVSVDPKNPLHLVCSTINTWERQSGSSGDQIYVSADGGETWTNVFEKWTDKDKNGVTWVGGHSIHWAGSIEFDPFNTKRVFVVSGNGMWMTEDIDAANVSWKFQVKGLEETVPLDLVSIPGGPAVSVIGDYDGFTHVDPETYPAIHTPQIGTSTGVAFAALKPDYVVRVGGDNKGKSFPLFYSDDKGKTWAKFKTKPSSKTPYKGRVAISADASVVLWVPEKEGQAYRTQDWGQTWTVAEGLKGPNLVPVADAVNPLVFYAYLGTNGNFLTSTDGGKTFAQVSKTGRGGTGLIRSVLGFEGHVWVPQRQGGLARTTDAGKTWTKISGVSDCLAVGLGKAAPGKDYPAVYIWGTVGGVRGIFRSVDQGASWMRINDDAHEYGGPGNGQFIVGDANVFGRVYMSTAGRGIVYGQPQP